MGTLGYFVLFLLLFLVGKFIYDSYLTNQTKEKWLEHQKTKKSTDSKELKESIDLLAKEFNCKTDDYIVSICQQLEDNKTTVFQAKEMINGAEENIVRESKNRGIKPKNTTSSLLVKIINNYISKIKREVIEYDSDVYISKAKYFNRVYSKEYLGGIFDCKGWQVETKVQGELRIETLENLLWSLNEHKYNCIKEAKSSQMDKGDTPSGIIFEIAILEVNRRLRKIMEFTRILYHKASSDPFFKAKKEEIQEFKVNLELFNRIETETADIDAFFKDIDIVKNGFNDLKRFFPEIENR